VLFFADKITIPLIKKTNKQSILEIGSSYGNSIKPLLDLPNLSVSVIDPCIDIDLFKEFGKKIHLHKGLSLEILPRLQESFDCIFIDGDHNWYTVFNELKLIEERGLLKQDGIIFLHDIGWPYGRRDMYYQPETVPAEHRRPFAKLGMKRGRSSLLAEGGFNSEHWNATEESRDMNGVLTAAEDYLKHSSKSFYFIKDWREFGFGILMSKSSHNTWKIANSLRLEILRQIWVDPSIDWVGRRLSQLRSSPPADGARRVRTLLRKWKAQQD
jgi:SAM-dependent methyltransferase